MTQNKVYEVFEVLARADKLGPSYKKIDDLIKATADSLNLLVTDEVVVTAREYMRYEIMALAVGKKPLSLTAWTKNRSK